MYFQEEELEKFGFKSLGKNVSISTKASIYGAGNMSIGDNVRIDDFCIISAGEEGIEIKAYTHIACYVSMIGKAKITIEEFVGISGGTAIYSSSDDFSGGCFTIPTVPEQYRKVINKPVLIERNCIVGARCVILPGSTIQKNSAIGAMSLVNGLIPAFEMWGGNPIKFIKERKPVFESEFLIEQNREDLFSL